MGQAEIRVDLGAIRANVARVRAGTSAEVMAVVKADGYGHGMVPVARAALSAGATWLGVCTLGEALELRRAGVRAPVLAWLIAPGQPLQEGLTANVDLSASSVGLLDEIVEAARRTGEQARVHLKIDTGLSRGGAVPAEWPALCEAAAKAHADGPVQVVGVWSHFHNANAPDHGSMDRQLELFQAGLETATRLGLAPTHRHIANSAATLVRPDAHFDLVRTGLAIYGLPPVTGRDFGLRPAMSVRARVVLTKRVPGGQGVSYTHAYRTGRETTLALIPMGYADGVPRAASGQALVRLGGVNRIIAGRVCMDQIVLDCGDDPVAAGDEAVLFGPGTDGELTVDDWAEALGTINYEIIARMPSIRVPRVYVDDDDGSREREERASASPAVANRGVPAREERASASPAVANRGVPAREERPRTKDGP